METTTPKFNIDYSFKNGCKESTTRLNPKNSDKKGFIQFYTKNNCYRIETLTEDFQHSEAIDIFDGVETLTRKVFEHLDGLYKELGVEPCREADRQVIQNATIVWTNSFE